MVINTKSREYVTEEEQQQGPDIERITKAVCADIQRANSFFTGKVEPVLRERHQLYEADRAYYKKRFPVISEQSDFVSYDFWSMVQWAIPGIMNSFFNGDDAIVITGRSAEDMRRAELLRKLIDWQIITQNKGFLVMWDWFTDAFQYNLGAVKVYWKRETEPQSYLNEYVDESRLMMIQADPMCQLIDAQGPDEFGMFYASWQIMRLKENRPVIEAVRVTDLRWSPEARNIGEANFVAHRKMVSADHMRRQAKAGVYDAEAVEKAIEKEGSGHYVYTAFEQELNDELGENKHTSEEDPARSLFELYECYTKLDINGDGMLEDCLITVVGDTVLRCEENPWGRVPIFTLSPVRDAFKVLSDVSYSEIVGEIQSLKTALIRQFIVNTANVNNIRHFVNQTMINVTDLQENRQYIRTNGDPRTVAMPFPQSTVAPWTMNFFEWLEGILEQWTGQTRYNQGTDSKSLNKTATGINLLQQASAQRIDYIIRVFAETGFGEMLRFLVELNQRYMDQPQVLRLNNELMQVTPDDLKGEFDIDVNTEAGLGKKKQNVANMQMYLSAIAPTGMQVGAVTPGEWAAAAQKLLTDSGIRDPERYVLDPEIVKQQFFMQMAQAMMTGGAPNDGTGAVGADAGGTAGAQMA